MNILNHVPLRMLAMVVLVVGVLGCANSVRLSQPAPVGDLVVARFHIDIDGLESNYPGKAGGLLPAIVEGVQVANDAREAAETLRHPEGSPVKTAFDSMYAAVADALANEMGLHLLPIDTLKGQVPYLIGYPMGNAADVARSGRYAGVLDVTVEVTVPDQGESHVSFFGTGKNKTRGHPEMKLSVRMLDASGQVLWRDHARVRSKEQVVLDERWVLGFRTDREVPDASSLPDLTRQAVTALLRKSRPAA